MYYYLVWVRSAQYRGSEALTYAHEAHLEVGTIVEVPLRKERVLGLIIKQVTKPHFVTKHIDTAFNTKSLPLTSIQLGEWLQQYYPAPIGVIASQFLPRALHSRYLQAVNPIAALPLPETQQPPLTDEQQAALETMQVPDTYLLHGRTGSGKTRIYIELARATLRAGRSVLVLSPEIGLTSQLAANFQTVFGDRVVILHSQLTLKERELAWLTILTADTPLIVIGPRSALFSPLRNIGLIIVDESHDQAYKQEQAPYYHSLRVASQLRVLQKAILVLGSATPSVADYYVAQQKSRPIIKLNKLAVPSSFTRDITIVDLKDRAQFTRANHLSLALIEAVSHSLERHEQAMLYLNRRGTARVALCSLCGWQALCPHCDLALTYHGDNYTLRCHVCSYSTTAITNCPDCGNPSLTFHSFGTKAIVDEVRGIFPEARILRFDTDNLKSERLEHQYSNIINGQVDILIGTQMLAKGLDLPKLSTLGIVLADSSLYVPDYTAQERTYQLLTQVIGRVGRGHVNSRIILQTYNPQSALIEAALSNDWDTFYNAEIAEREKYFFPPFSYLLKLTVARSSSHSAEAAALKLKYRLQAQQWHIQVDGPAPAFHEKAGTKFVWQVIIKARSRAVLLRIVAELPNGWNYDIDPANLI